MAFVHLHERPLPVAFGPGHIPIPFIRMWEGDSWFRCLSWALRWYVTVVEIKTPTDCAATNGAPDHLHWKSKRKSWPTSLSESLSSHWFQFVLIDHLA